MKPILVAAAVILALAAGPSAQARTPPTSHATRKLRVHLPRPPKLRTPKSAYRTVRIHRADGTVVTGYRDSLGTHLTGPDGRTIHCRRQPGAADIDVACR